MNLDLRPPKTLRHWPLLLFLKTMISLKPTLVYTRIDRNKMNTSTVSRNHHVFVYCSRSLLSDVYYFVYLFVPVLLVFNYITVTFIFLFVPVFLSFFLCCFNLLTQILSNCLYMVTLVNISVIVIRYWMCAKCNA